MTVLERRAEFMRSVMNDTDEVFIKLERAYKKISKREPCMYSTEEVNARIDKFEKELESGNYEGIAHETVMAEYGL